MRAVDRLRKWNDAEAGTITFGHKGPSWNVSARRDDSPRFVFEKSDADLEKACSALIAQLEQIGETVPTQE